MTVRCSLWLEKWSSSRPITRRIKPDDWKKPGWNVVLNVIWLVSNWLIPFVTRTSQIYVRITYLSLLFISYLHNKIIRHSRIYTIRKRVDCKKCHAHLVSFIKHHGLFVPYIVDIFDCKKCHTDLVSFTKHHGLFVPYIVDIFIFLIRESWFSPPYMSPGPRFPFFLWTRKSWFSFHSRHRIHGFHVTKAPGIYC